ncbi:MAG: hypothetical protein FWG10_01005 [Eubacteriaceae bacterium]|nr:hypothetical protein [Eubacteriaceae bacterium]
MTRKKTIIMASICVCMASLFHVRALARPQGYPEGMDFEYISGTIVSSANRYFVDELPREITSRDVDFSNAYIIYAFTNIFELETNDFEDLKKELEKGLCFIELPVYIGEGRVVAGIQRVEPATKEELALMADPEGYAAKVGTWDVASIGYEPPGSQ